MWGKQLFGFGFVVGGVLFFYVAPILSSREPFPILALVSVIIGAILYLNRFVIGVLRSIRKHLMT